MKDRKEVEAPPFRGASALIAAEKESALAAFDRGRFRTRMLLRLDVRQPRVGWAAPRLALAAGLVVLAAAWAVLGPGSTNGSSRPIEERVIRRALQHAAPHAIRPAVVPGDQALSGREWTIERSLLTWRRLQGGRVDVERGLDRSRSAGAEANTSGADPAAARDARRRLEHAPIGAEMERLIRRALARQSRI